MNNYIKFSFAIFVVLLCDNSLASTRPPPLRFYRSIHQVEQLEPIPTDGVKPSRSSLTENVKWSRSLSSLDGKKISERVRREAHGTNSTIPDGGFLDPRSRSLYQGHGMELTRSLIFDTLRKEVRTGPARVRRSPQPTVKGALSKFKAGDPVVLEAVKLAVTQAGVGEPIYVISATKQFEGRYSIEYQAGQAPNIASCNAQVRDHGPLETPRFEIISQTCIA